MERLATHKTKIDYYNKVLECLSDVGEKIMLQGIKKAVTLKKITMIQVN